MDAPGSQSCHDLLPGPPPHDEEEERVIVELFAQSVVDSHDMLARVGPTIARALCLELVAGRWEERGTDGLEQILDAVRHVTVEQLRRIQSLTRHCVEDAVPDFLRKSLDLDSHAIGLGLASLDVGQNEPRLHVQA